MTTMGVFVLIKISSEDEDEKRLHQDECLLDTTVMGHMNILISSNLETFLPIDELQNLAESS